MGQTRVDLQHLLEDLRDAYPDAIEETILSEVVANSLDSGASNVHVLNDPTAAGTSRNRPLSGKPSSGISPISQGVRRPRASTLLPTSLESFEVPVTSRHTEAG